MSKTTVEWKINTPQLLKELGENTPEASILRQPLMILGNILSQVGERAAELNDSILNGLMCRLAIYEISDPYNSNFDKKKLEQVMKDYTKARSETIGTKNHEK